MLELTRILLKFWKPSKKFKADKENFCIYLRRATEKLLKCSFNQKHLRPITFLSYLDQIEIDDLKQKIFKSVKQNAFANYRWGYKVHLIENLKLFFKMNGVKKAFKFLKEKMKLGGNISHYCKRFKLLCCLEDTHGLECQAKWKELFRFLDSYFIDSIVKDKNIECARLRDVCENYLVD